MQIAGPRSNIIFVGLSPTKNEYSSSAFRGFQSSILNTVLKPFGRNSEQYYKTYLVKQHISGLNSSNTKIANEAWESAWKMEDWGKILIEEIETINPRVIIIFGNKTLDYFCGVSSIEKYRGSVLSTHRPELLKYKINFIPMRSPKELFEGNMREAPIAQWDFSKALELEFYPKVYEEPMKIWIPNKYEQLENWWFRVKRADPKYITLDIETFMDFITCVGFSHDGVEGISIDFLTAGGKSRFPPEEMGHVYKLVGNILKSKIPKVNQAIGYDATVLNHWGFEVNNFHGCTMLLGHCCYPELPKNLGFLGSIHTKSPYHKDEGKGGKGTSLPFDPNTRPSLLTYNAKDAVLAHKIYTAQLEDAKSLGVLSFYREKVWPAFFVYKKLDTQGFMIDEDKRRKLLGRYKPIAESELLDLQMLAENRDFNPNSSKQVGIFLYEILGLPEKTHINPKGEKVYSTDEKIIDGIILKHKLPPKTLEVVFKYKLYKKITNIIRFIEGIVVHQGKFLTSLNLAGTESGRTSGSHSPLNTFTIEDGKMSWDYIGSSPQTIPKHGVTLNNVTYGKDIRELFVAPPGFEIISGDQSQAEARVVAVLAEDWDLLRSFSIEDIHIRTASRVYQKRYEDVSSIERQKGKVFRHGGNYNESPVSIMLRTHLPYNECVFIERRFHEESPLIRAKFHVDIREEIKRVKELRSPFGRLRQFFGNINEDMYKEGYSTIPQATVTDHTKFNIIVPMDRLYPSKLDAQFVVEAHDGVDYMVRKGLREKFLEDLNKCMLTPINFTDCSLSRDVDLQIPGEYAAGECWGLQESIKL